MNCANHPERTATAFCQNCGKPLCRECARGADGLILCEPCLLSRAAAAGAADAYTAAASGPRAGWGGSSGSAPSASSSTSASSSNAVPVPPGAAGAWQPVSQGYAPVTGTAQTSPGLAALLGFIPGVGAMYNGQFVKALLHVIIFIVLIGTAEHLPLVGILIAAWVFYQVFDAAQTAAARRDGRPLPDPFGILDMSQRLGPQQPSYPPAFVPGTSAGSSQNPPMPFQPAPGQPQPSGPGFLPLKPMAYPPSQRRGEPIGAIVLIAVGLLFLLSTLGILDVDWIGRGWPVLVLLLGIWLLFRRATAVPSFGPAAPAPFAADPVFPGPARTAPASDGPLRPAPSPRANPLSITPEPGVPHQDPQVGPQEPSQVPQQEPREEER